MPSKRKLLVNSKLYLILDAQVCGYDELFEKAKQSIASGVDIIQLRDKQGCSKNIVDFSKKMLALTRRKIPYIVNDRIDVTFAVKANGVHLGQDDLEISTAKKMLGSNAIIGISCQTLEHALKAQRDGADYIGFGSVFKTFTKPERGEMDLDLLKRVVERIKIPMFGIGGIDLSNLEKVTAIGLSRVAVCRAILKAKNINSTVKDFKALLKD